MSHGRYKVAVLPDDPGYMGPAVDPIHVPPGSTYPLGTLVLLERNATITGLVTDGDPVSDIPAIAWRLDAPGGAHTRSGTDGNYVLVYRYGYAFTVTDSNGQSIEQRFNQDVLITFSYDEAELRRMGISELWLKSAYFSTTTDGWTFPEGYVVDTVANVVAMQIDHFTGFALTGEAGYQVFLPLVLR